MKRLFFALFLFSTVLSMAQTNVSGAYFSNTNWSKAGSPYNVTGDVQVPAGITLSIEPGVQINFNGDYQILVKGFLMANGTNSLPIVFNSGSNTGKAMILFRSTNLSSSQMSNLQFNGPKYALQLEDETEHNQSPIKLSGVLTVKKISLTNTSVQTKGYETTASLILDSATVSSTLIRGNYPLSESITLKNSTISNSTINSDSYNKGIIIDNSTVSSSSFTLGCCGANFSILKSTVENSTFSEYNNYYQVTIRDSKIINSPINLPQSDYGFTISNSTLSCNTGTYVLKCKNLKMTSTEISGNTSSTCVELFGGANEIHNSKITNNSVGIQINGSSTLTIDSTNFYNNLTYNIKNLSTNNITAKKNWWGTTDATVISTKIYDFYDNINYGIVDFADNLATSLNTISLQIGLNGGIKENNISLGNGSTISVAKGATKTFTIIPNTGYEVATLLYNNVDVRSQITNNQYTTPVVNANATFKVTFKKVLYKITVQTSSSGSMNIFYEHGSTPTFDFTPSDGSKLQSVFYNNTDVTSKLVGNVYTLPAITANGLLVVTFASVSTEVNKQTANIVTVYTTNSKIIVSGTSKDEIVKLYSINGKELQTQKSEGEHIEFTVYENGVFLIKTMRKTFKVVL